MVMMAVANIVDIVVAMVFVGKHIRGESVLIIRRGEHWGGKLGLQSQTNRAWCWPRHESISRMHNLHFGVALRG